jgi:hypothetical protein
MDARETMVAVVLLAAALTPAGCATGTTSAEASPIRPGVISVSGSAKVSVKPDTALVQLGAETRAPALADATADVNRRMSAVLQRVKSLGVEDRDLTTVTYSIDPLTAPRRSEQEPPSIVGYRVANIVRLKIRNLDAVGRIIDAAVAAGANTMRSLHFTVDDPTKPEAEARALAVRDAAARARTLAEAGGVRLGELLSLTEGVAPPRPLVERLATMAGPGPIESGQLEIAVSVTAHYRIVR